MAKYNLLDDDDIFEEEKEETIKQDSSELHTSEPEIDINIDDDFDLEPASLSDEEFKTDIMDSDLDEESNEVMQGDPQELDEDPHFDNYAGEEKEVKTKPTSYYTDDYADSGQEGVNYAPFIKIFVVILILTGIYFLVDIFILSDSGEEIVQQEENVKTPEQIRQEQVAAERATFLSKISGKTNSDVRFVSSIISGVQSSAKLSSALYYGDTFLLQIFGSTRKEVARAQMTLRDAGNSFEILSSDIRPGSSGGVLSSYSLEVKNSESSSGQSTEIFSSVSDFENWVNQTSSTNDLKVKLINNKYLNEESGFKKYEIVTTLNGSVESCNKFLQKLSNDGAQVKIHKLNLSASDQRSFKPGKYQLKLILELFV